MGHVADICQPTSHDNSGSYDGGDTEVQMTRLATGPQFRPPRGNKTRSGTSSEETARRLAAASRVASGTGSSRDGRENPARFNLED
jgi:hypothetical protein